MFINGSTHSLFGFTECVTGAFIGNTIPHCEPYMLNICINWISYMPAICCLLSVWCESLNKPVAYIKKWTGIMLAQFIIGML